MPKVKKFSDISSMSFEQALAELEQIVQKLEGSGAQLEESIEIYERGAALKSHCETKLKEAEGKIQKIIMGEGGEIDAKPFDAVE